MARWGWMLVLGAAAAAVFAVWISVDDDVRWTWPGVVVLVLLAVLPAARTIGGERARAAGEALRARRAPGGSD